MPNREDVNFASPANAAILAYLQIADPAGADFMPAEEVHALGLGMSLGTHPDLVDYFWGLAEGLAARGGVINGRSSPILVNPASGVIFGLAGGTGTLAFRLPEPEYSAAMAVPGYGASYHYPKSVVTARDMGIDWALVKLFEKVNPAWCRRAFEHAGSLG